MSFYTININDTKHYITSFKNSEVFYDYFRNMINNVECNGICLQTGISCQNKFFFEKYTTDKAIRFKNNVMIDYMINHTEEFFDFVNDTINRDSPINGYTPTDGYNNEYYIYFYFSNYAIMVDSELNMYKIYLGKPDTFITSETKYHLSHEPIESTFHFKDSYTFSDIDELKNNIIKCLKANCADMSINDYCVFDAVSSNKVDIINNMVIRNYIIDNVDSVINNVFVNTIVINMYDKVCAYKCHTILIEMSNNNINVSISRTYYY